MKQSDDGAGAPVVEPVGDAACGDSGTRQEFAETKHKLVSRAQAVPTASKDFVINLVLGSGTCLRDRKLARECERRHHYDLTGRTYKFGRPRVPRHGEPSLVVGFPVHHYSAGIGRTVRLHPREGLLKEARALQQSPRYSRDIQSQVMAGDR